MTTHMTGPQLVDRYNSLVDTATGLGIQDYRPVSRFSSAAVGRRRVAALEAEVAARQRPPIEAGEGSGVPVPTEKEVDLAKQKQAPKRGRPTSNGEDTVRGLTQRFNELVPKARKAGITWAKTHASLFGSKEHGLAMVKKLERELARA
jgi:hypothetical protein